MYGFTACVKSMGNYFKFPVQSDEFEICLGSFGHERHLHRPLGFHCRKIFGNALFPSPSQRSPQVYFPLEFQFQPYLGIHHSGFTVIIHFLTVCISPCPDRRPQRRIVYSVQIAHFLHAGGRGQYVLVVFKDLFYEVGQSSIRIDVPPLHVGQCQGVRISLDNLLRHVELWIYASFHGRA